MKKENFTYEHQYGWLNVDGIPMPDTGLVTKWMTKDSVPIMIPDQWAKNRKDQPAVPHERLPDKTKAYQIGTEKLVTVEEFVAGGKVPKAGTVKANKGEKITKAKSSG